jgi:subtilisin family serine protease
MPIHDHHRARRPRWIAAATLLATLALAAAWAAPSVGATEPIVRAPQSPRAAGTTDLAPAATGVEDEILIRYRPGTSAADRAAVARAEGLTPLSTSADGRTQVVTASGRAMVTVRRNLHDDPRVVAVAPNHQRELAVDPTGEPSFGDEWALDNTGQTLSGTSSATGVAGIDIDGRQALASGAGDPAVVVAVIDDGVDFSHPDLADRAWTNPGEAGAKANNHIDDDHNGYIDDVHGWDFCNNDNTLHDAGMDGHGTHVAGTIAASLNGLGTVGVAPGVRIMALKFIDDGRACGTDDLAVAAIDYAASFRVPVVNASWGGSEPSSVLDATIAGSRALFVAAAGNGGANLDLVGGVKFYPASSSLANVLAVTAVDQSGKLASFSNYGTTTVDLGAPGTNILSTYPADPQCPAPCYAWSAGTSMAAPHVSGVAALAASHQASLRSDPISLRGRLLASGRALTSLSGKTTTGRMVNAMRAIDVAPPKVHAANRYGFGVGSVIGARSITTIVRWPSATDATTGIAGYRIRRQGPDGWTDVGHGVTTTTVKSSLRYGNSYVFRLRATDGAGNVGGPADGPSVTPTLHADSTTLATYGSGWSTTASSGATGGRMHTTTRAGASMTFAFTGRSVALVSPRGASRGSAKVYVDGVYDSTISLYRAKVQSQVVVFARSWPGKAAHTVKLVALGTSGHPRVDVDGFVVIR